jgi:hypothetical protein
MVKAALIALLFASCSNAALVQLSSAADFEKQVIKSSEYWMVGFVAPW